VPAPASAAAPQPCNNQKLILNTLHITAA
jgi:hypothetical protein